jgi:protein gp37
VPGHPYEQGFDLRVVPEKWAEPFAWGRQRMVFVNSMSDLFHRGVDDATIVAITRVMSAADWHTYQVLTKRSERLRDMLRGPLRFAAEKEHIWWGVSVEDRAHGLPRVEHLQAAPAGLRMLSVEPLLEDLGALDLGGIGWVIAGGESGPGARPLDPGWVRAVRDRCRAADVPFFFKQWGGVRKRRTGRLLDGRTHDDVPQRPASAVPTLAGRRRLAAECLART